VHKTREKHGTEAAKLLTRIALRRSRALKIETAKRSAMGRYATNRWQRAVA